MRFSAWIRSPALGLSVALLQFVVHLIAVAGSAYWIWWILVDWAHISFTRVVALLFCLWLGALCLAMVGVQALRWRRAIGRRA